jgi:GMP synthase (glutamine-hydrolysing)
VPVLGICYGMQLMAQDLGGRVERTGASEFGKTGIRVAGALAAGLPEEQTAWMSHRDSVTAPPEGAVVTGGSDSTPIAAFEAPERGLYGVQFHPEVVHTPHGQEVLKNFLYGVAGARLRTPAAVIGSRSSTSARRSAMSGCSAASPVASTRGCRPARAQGGRRPAHLRVRRHGLLRKDEAAQVVETFEGHFHVPLSRDAAARFLAGSRA